MSQTTTEWVEITVNGRPRRMHPGRHTGAEIKVAGEVPPSDELNQVINHELIFVPDDKVVDIVGHEVFISNPKSGSSS